YDSDVYQVLPEWKDHPMMRSLLRFSFPDTPEQQVETLLLGCHSIRDFQIKVIYPAVDRILRESSEGLTTSGFEKLRPGTAYLFFSNHRDIVLDTSLLNYTLLKNGLIITASAIGDNLVQDPFLSALAKLNRNFLIHRGLSPKERLVSSRLVSEYIRTLVTRENRSVWIAQREGRTKDGDDKTQQGVLKMLALAGGDKKPTDYFKKLKIVPVSISYEVDPTDTLKMPELMAKHHEEPYTKTYNEDFNTILKGVTGQKKRIHIAVGNVLDEALDEIADRDPVNQQFQLLADKIDDQINANYKLWPSNYIAYDLLNETQRYKTHYSEAEKKEFQLRMSERVEADDDVATRIFLAMYANPVVNKLKMHV
ncbi:MAG: 1-acyl-sn-glycerol-3-phosphate acyltransferase, partial [Sinomicrobium sp.]|nr:1-acyl-sn-glycerol-3-phosphate acyltransferase [Sinomicrobium sp.]